MPSFRRRGRSLTAKALTISAIGMGVGFGTCGLAAIAGGGRSLSVFIIYAGAILFFLSLAALVITALIALGIRIEESFRK